MLHFTLLAAPLAARHFPSTTGLKPLMGRSYLITLLAIFATATRFNTIVVYAEPAQRGNSFHYSPGPMDNEVVGKPVVECGRDWIKFHVATRKPFKGKVYVKGEYDNANCMQSYGSDDGNDGGNGRRTSSEVIDEEEDSSAFHHTRPPSSFHQRSPNGGGRSSSSATSSHGSFSAATKTTTGSGGTYAVPETGVLEVGSRSIEVIGASAATAAPTSGIWRAVHGYRGEEDEEDNELLAPPNPLHPSSTTQRQGEQPPPSGHPHPGLTLTQEQQQLTKRAKPSRTLGVSPTANSPFPGFTTLVPGAGTPPPLQEVANWRSFLRGRPGHGGQDFRRYGSKISPDANGECPLVCPPCEQCHKNSNDRLEGFAQEGSGERIRRKATNKKSPTQDAPSSSSSTGMTKTKKAALKVRLGTCHARRDRIASPPGVHISFTVVVSFHEAFITRLDRSYHVECTYEEAAERKVAAELGVSPPPVVELDARMEPPHCHYRIVPAAATRGSASTSSSLNSVHVGDEIVHEWVCRRADDDSTTSSTSPPLSKFYGLLVHDCYADDGKGRRVLMLDARGCAVDTVILPTPSYDEGSGNGGELRAVATSLVAKFPDQEQLGFQCAITVCMRELGHCSGITPPRCDRSAASFDTTSAAAVDFTANRTRRSAMVQKASNNATTDSNWQLSTPLLTVLDNMAEGDEHDLGSQAGSYNLEDSSTTTATTFRPVLATNRRTREERAQNAAVLEWDVLPSLPAEFCLSIAAFGIMVASSTFLITISAAALVAILLLRSDHCLQSIANSLLYKANMGTVG